MAVSTWISTAAPPRMTQPRVSEPSGKPRASRPATSKYREGTTPWARDTRSRVSRPATTPRTRQSAYAGGRASGVCGTSRGGSLIRHHSAPHRLQNHGVRYPGQYRLTTITVVRHLSEDGTAAATAATAVPGRSGVDLITGHWRLSCSARTALPRYARWWGESSGSLRRTAATSASESRMSMPLDRRRGVLRAQRPNSRPPRAPSATGVSDPQARGGPRRQSRSLASRRQEAPPLRCGWATLR